MVFGIVASSRSFVEVDKGPNRIKCTLSPHLTVQQASGTTTVC